MMGDQECVLGPEYESENEDSSEFESGEEANNAKVNDREVQVDFIMATNIKRKTTTPEQRLGGRRHRRV